MNNWFIGAICVFTLIFDFYVGYMISASTTGWECRNLGMFYVGEKVYECKIKEKNT
jgi:hypothetical protein